MTPVTTTTIQFCQTCGAGMEGRATCPTCGGALETVTVELVPTVSKPHISKVVFDGAPAPEKETE
jgi:hypothetical protein